MRLTQVQWDSRQSMARPWEIHSNTNITWSQEALPNFDYAAQFYNIYTVLLIYYLSDENVTITEPRSYWTHLYPSLETVILPLPAPEIDSLNNERVIDILGKMVWYTLPLLPRWTRVSHCDHSHSPPAKYHRRDPGFPGSTTAQGCSERRDGDRGYSTRAPQRRHHCGRDIQIRRHYPFRMAQQILSHRSFAQQK